MLSTTLLQGQVRCQRSDVFQRRRQFVSVSPAPMRLLSELYSEILSEVDLLTTSPFYQNAQLVLIVDDQILRLRMWASHVDQDRVELLEALENDMTAANLVSIARFNLERILELVECIARSKDSYVDAIDQLEERIECLYVIKHGVDDVRRNDQIKQFHHRLLQADRISQSRAPETPKPSWQQKDLTVFSSGQAITHETLSSDDQDVLQRPIRTGLDPISTAHRDWSGMPKGGSTSTLLGWNRTESRLSRSTTTHQQDSISEVSTATSISSYGQESDSGDEEQDMTFSIPKFPRIGVPMPQGPVNMPTHTTIPRKNSLVTPDTSQNHELKRYKNLEDAAADEICTWYLRWNFDNVAFAFDQFTFSGEESVKDWRLDPILEELIPFEKWITVH